MAESTCSTQSRQSSWRNTYFRPQSDIPQILVNGGNAVPFLTFSDGATREAKLGFLDYMLRDYHPESDREIVFVPVGINYDRVIEDRSLLRKLDRDAGRRSTGFVIKTSLRFLFKQLMLSRRDRWRRFGYASVNFGEPLSVQGWCQKRGVEFVRLEQEARFVEVGRLANALMKRITDVVPVLPVPLLASVVLEHRNDWGSALAIKTYALEKIEQLREQSAVLRKNSCSLRQQAIFMV